MYSEGLQGAGKSTLLNALLDELNLIPTSGMRACTAVLVEIRHGSAGGGLSFVPQVHWPTSRHAAGAAEPLGSAWVASVLAFAERRLRGDGGMRRSMQGREHGAGCNYQGVA